MTGEPHDESPAGYSRLAQLHPRAFLSILGVAGAIATIGFVWLFLAIAEEIPEKSALVRADVVVAAWVDAHGTEWGEKLFVWVSYLGAPVVMASITAVFLWLLWRRERRDATALAVTAVGGVLLSNVLKLVFHRGRPETAVEFITRHSWSFPSGHAMNSMISYGFLTVLLFERIADRRRRLVVLTLAALLIGLIGFSRLYLGVHYLSDVVGGWLAGAAWLIVCITGYRVSQRQRSWR